MEKLNYEKLYDTGYDVLAPIRLYKFIKKLSKGNPDLSGAKFKPTKYFAIYDHPDYAQIVVFPVSNTLSNNKMDDNLANELKDLSANEAWQTLMEFYRCECAGALSTGDVSYDISLMKSDKGYLDELWELNQ